MKNILKYIYYLAILVIFLFFSFMIIFILIKKPDLKASLILFGIFYTTLILIGNYLPLLSAYAGRLQPLIHGELFDMVKDVFSSLTPVNSKIKVFIRPSIKKPNANASVQGFSNFNIILNQDFIDELDKDEVKSVIYHEAYHIKSKHDLKRTITLICFGIFPLIYFSIIASLSLSEDSMIFWSIWGVLLYLCGALAVLHIYRHQELKADAYSAKMMGTVSTFISALQKMTYKNNEKTKSGVIRHLLSTHPCLTKRIEHLTTLGFNSELRE